MDAVGREVRLGMRDAGPSNSRVAGYLVDNKLNA
jgi:hypothetical protein